ncbi:BCNT-domain-containing protein [Macrolepiota fuliginosa MF-IS2]|uniref:SWR1-complex protein 5 n=1 Tax=Macrolepiota fuliginosa MF-IS2 TaxID=1400762 RepID=A0A9P5X3X5_9AGAR|nr:BCNT-domain-containing protein [Macrolepiota fuliginosa MF-IS2]
MSPTLPTQSDSEGDEEYVPPTRGELSSDNEDENLTKGQSARSPEPSAEDTENKKKDRDALWASFQASAASSSEKKIEKVEEEKRVRIQKKYLFAGEYITEVVEVAEDSPDAKKWPVYREEGVHADDQRCPTLEHQTPSTSLPVGPARTGPTPPSKPPPKKPGPRKPKTVLGAVPSSSSQKPKKLTTLDKSMMDWKAHTQDTALQDELETNRKGGGYLEKVDFLQRVEDRKEENLEAMKSRKRRKL